MQNPKGGYRYVSVNYQNKVTRALRNFEERIFVMKKYITYAALLLTSGALLSTTYVVNAETTTSTTKVATSQTTSQYTSEKEAIDQLVKEGKIKVEDAEQVKLVGFSPRELTQVEGNQEKIAFNQNRDPKGTWMQTDGRWWFKYGSGGYAKNWEQLDGKWYYFDNQGWMKSNEWINPDGKWYYLSNDGSMLTDYNRVNGKPYFFRSDGVLVENKGQAIAEYAETFVDKIPYVWGGADLNSGVDCSGFTMAIHARFDIAIPRGTEGQATGGKFVYSGSQLPGDLILYNTEQGSNQHVGIYVGGGKVVHAPFEGRKVSYMDANYLSYSVSRRYWE